MLRQIAKDATDQSVIIRFLDDPEGMPVEDIEHDSSDLELWYRREGGLKVTFAAASLAALNTAHTDGGIEHISDGYYRVDGPDAAFTDGADGVEFGGSAFGVVGVGCYVPLVAFDPQDAVSLGLSGVKATDTSGGELAAFDLADAIETGLTLRQALRLIAAAVAGELSGAGTATEVFRNAVADSKARITATVDAVGNRTAITTDLT